MATKKTVDSIRDYLNTIGQDSKPVVDKEGVKKLKADIRSERDPIEKLRLMSELEVKQQGEVPDNSGLEAVFVAEAKAWAEGEGISVSSFQSLGVPDVVLRRAGFDVLTGGRKPSASITSGGRAKRLDAEADVLPVAQGLGETFTIPQLAQAIEREVGTTRTYVNKLVDAGKVVDTGEEGEPEAGRGRAPKLYKVA